MPWKLRCNECGTEWLVNISFDISKQKSFYIYCKVCKRNTFNTILGYSEPIGDRTCLV
jgi:transcription elongation factor Elf1